MKRIQRVYAPLLIFAFLASPITIAAQAAAAGARPGTEVIVLCTLHQLHEERAFYSFDTLSQIVETLGPDVLALELTPGDLANRKEQKVKQEYQRSIFPYLKKHGLPAVPMEPPEPLFSELVSSMRKAQHEMEEKAPAKDEAFGTYVDSLYDFLLKSWDSPLTVNSPQTDALFEVKHKFQNALYGTAEERGWEGWNEHFLARIMETVQKNPGKRVVVVVGVEHGYWLRKRLHQQPEVSLVALEEALLPPGDPRRP